MNYLTVILPIIAFGLYAWLRERSFERTVKAYEAVIVNLNQDKKELLDRFFVFKGQPPVGVDIKATHEKKEAEKEEDKKARKHLRRGDPLQQERDRLVMQELQHNPDLIS